METELCDHILEGLTINTGNSFGHPPSMAILQNWLISQVLVYIPLHNLLLLLFFLKKGINSCDLLLTSEYNYIHIYTATL